MSYRCKCKTEKGVRCKRNITSGTIVINIKTAKTW